MSLTKKGMDNCNPIAVVLCGISSIVELILLIPICIPLLLWHRAQQFDYGDLREAELEARARAKEEQLDDIPDEGHLQMVKAQARRELEQSVTAMVAQYGFEKIPTSEEFAAVYREEIKKAHPDNGGSEEEFVRVKENLDIISTAIRTLESDGRPSEKDLDRILKWHEEKQTG